MSDAQQVRRTDELERAEADLRLSEVDADDLDAWRSNVLLNLPGVRGAWPCSAVGTAGEMADIGAFQNHLTRNGNPVFSFDGLAPIAVLNGTGDYFSITDAASGNTFDFIGSEGYIAAAAKTLALHMWVKFTNAAGTLENLMSKWAGDGTRSYQMRRVVGGQINFRISVDGTSISDTISSTAIPQANTWTCITATFDRGTEIAVFVDGEKNTAASATTNIFNSAADFVVGANSVGANPLTASISTLAACTMRASDDIAVAFYEMSRGIFGV